MHTYIIAEAGVNHNGSLELAKILIDTAKEAGADCVKFQTYKTELLVTDNAPKADYQKENDKTSDSQFEMLKKLELSYSDFEELYIYAKERQIDFLSTPFDMESAEFLSGLGMKMWKIPSGEITNLPLLEFIGSKKQKVVLSTGMSELFEIEDAINVLRKVGCDDICLLHCTTQYPAPYESVNLIAMKKLQDSFGTEVGYSDHTVGNEVAVAAVGMGAKIIEKHFTLDKNMDGPDHKASLEPKELKDMVTAIRHIDAALGKGEKIVQAAEAGNRLIARKSIVARCPISKGEVITEDMLIMKRPGTGISPMRLGQVVGTKAVRDFDTDELIEL